MKQMKNKLIAGAALASLAFGLVACGDDSSSTVLVVGDDAELSSSSNDDASSSSVKAESSSSVAKDKSSSSVAKDESSSSVAKDESSSSAVKDESSSSAKDESSSSVEEVSSSSAGDVVTAAVFGSDYTTGELRWVINGKKISEKSIAFFQDSKVIANGSDLYVLERMKADNITKLNSKELEEKGAEAVVWQISLDDNANPVDLAFDGENAWVALQNADSLVKISTKDGKISKSIKTTDFAYEGEASPYVADIELNGGKLYVLMQRYTSDPATWVTTYPQGLLAIYDASTGDLKDTVQLLKKNPTAMTFFDGSLYVASQGEYNAAYGTDADEERGIEKVNIAEKKSELVVSGKTLGGGIYSFAAEDGIAYAAIYKAYGDVPLAKIDLAAKKASTVEGIVDAEGSLAVKGGVVYVGDRSYANEKVFVVKDGKASAVESVEGALAPYSITLL
jgi:biotin carboxyl carrier protein